jgi:hypothetical protein
MCGWQQTLIDERGGSDGGDLDRLVAVTHLAHEGTNPIKGHIMRAVLLGR